eukprot:5286913-Pyramimonas_sp.AAC.2
MSVAAPSPHPMPPRELSHSRCRPDPSGLEWFCEGATMLENGACGSPPPSAEQAELSQMSQMSRNQNPRTSDGDSLARRIGSESTGVFRRGLCCPPRKVQRTS